MIPMDRLEIAHYHLECWHTQSMRQKQKGGARVLVLTQNRYYYFGGEDLILL
jgi:hypothetical protein